MTEQRATDQTVRLALHQLRPPKGSKHRPKRIGRGMGSGHGKTATKGHKGQLARAGGGKRPGFEGGQMPLIRRLPKRGFVSLFKKEYAIVNLDALQRIQDRDEITPQVLADVKLIRSSSQAVKILGDGVVTRPLVVRAHRFSRQAAEKIHAAGGRTEILSDRA